MQENLKRFVRQQALRGENPERLREGLLLNGWDVKDVDHAISETYNIKKKISKGVIALSIILIVVFATSLLLIFNKLYFNEDKQIDENNKEVEQNTLTESNNCKSINDINLKEECYLEKIKKGYECADLIEDEQFYCMRTLEAHILEQVNS